LTSHPKLVILGISLAITFGVTVALGFVSMDQAFAGGPCTHCM
jgi:predicted outer membrane lipoprotein